MDLALNSRLTNFISIFLQIDGSLMNTKNEFKGFYAVKQILEKVTHPLPCFLQVYIRRLSA
jgi:hypothetical protein